MLVCCVCFSDVAYVFGNCAYISMHNQIHYLGAPPMSPTDLTRCLESYSCSCVLEWLWSPGVVPLEPR